MERYLAKENGISLSALIIYITAMTMLIAVVTTISMFIHSNVLKVDSNSQNIAEFNKFNISFPLTPLETLNSR